MLSRPGGDTQPWLSGIRVELEVGAATLESRVEAVREAELMLSPPTLQGRRVRVASGTLVRAAFYAPAGCWVADARVVGRIIGGQEQLVLREFSHWRQRQRRRTQRYPRRIAFELYRDDPGECPVLGCTEDISAEGFSAVLNEDVSPRPGELVGLRIYLALHQPPLSVRARIVRVQRRFGNSRGRVDVALSITEIEDSDRQTLEECLKRSPLDSRPPALAPPLAVGTSRTIIGTQE